MEDGCSKRFDIETVDFRPQSYNGGDPNARLNPRPEVVQNRLPAYNPSAAQFAMPSIPTGQVPHDTPLTSGPAPYLEQRHDYMAGTNGQNPVWSS